LNPPFLSADYKGKCNISGEYFLEKKAPLEVSFGGWAAGDKAMKGIYIFTAGLILPFITDLRFSPGNFPD
jgi:hypothetical protein